MQNNIKILPLVTMLALTACAVQPQPSVAQSNPQWKNLEIQCVHEKRPAISPETKQLYDYALYQDLHNMWNGKKGDAVWKQAAVYYRIAAYNGDYKANIRLQYLLETKRFAPEKPQTELYNLNKELEKQLPATAMYKLYYHLGSNFGVSTEKGGAFAFLRKAADMGSRDAQFELSEILVGIQDKETLAFRLSLREQLLTCSATQGGGDAAKWLGRHYESDKKYPQAVDSFHLGVKNGNRQSAFRLSNAFDIDAVKNRDYLGVKPDPERSLRYKMIKKFLSHHEYLHATVPDLDEIVPLPPAKLPRWDGKIAFQRWFEGPPPAKPSDELMQKLAKQAGLDWQTGLPLKK
ncbi:sel1 repeat family protein [Haemophilus haemoglobinophilus]|nr:sel1 repeat family protein [Canicola haemoglobinophilus]MBN6712208.1 sel1 repeat family protein [Canicola haemoglobinophilus]